MPKRAIGWLFILMITSGCGASASSASGGSVAHVAAASHPPAQVDTPGPTASTSAPGHINRGLLETIVAAGLGRFLQGVETEPNLDGNGRFVGFRLRSFYPSDARFASLDLQAGDTVLRVNGQSIERPEQALAVWHGLRVASELQIEYLRGSERRELRFTIDD